ncbi:ankyrin repeat and protein kinase domain-containing protein 1-like isoform X2 [Portunus trituberculatus]|uniref:ankyrin repeat and protein kinase domain-containing protein 1-like isoform X2 n=1 Tax=Portunus trituberculatus TaxID=210409 RepID=UPI001E1CE35D|nr:ankyrin repeat and protein kinase domain-containing protein 1-like isoform X2 [Portunus trituberculatus]
MASSPPDGSQDWLQALITQLPTEELVQGVHEGDEALVRYALAMGARPDVTVLNTGGLSLCMVCVAASEGHDHLLPHLLQAGLSIEGGGTDDMTPLMMAVENGHTHTVKALLSLGANTLATDRRGWTALHFAAWRGEPECVASLLPVTPATGAHQEGVTPVHVASYHGQVQVLKQLVGASWPLNARDSAGRTSLHTAASGGHISAVRWLVRRGGDPHVKDKNDCTPLDMAMLYGRHEVETWLAKNGGTGVTAGSKAPYVALEALREWQGQQEEHHNTVLSWMVEGYDTFMEYVPKIKDGHAINRDGLTALHAAALRGAPSGAVKALLKRGISPHVLTPNNETPADLARQEGHRPMIEALDTHQCEQSIESPEHLHQELLRTITHGDIVQAVSSLLCKGAPIDPFGGKSALRLAISNDRPLTVSLLLVSGAALPANLLREAWQSPDVTQRVLALLTTVSIHCCLFQSTAKL